MPDKHSLHVVLWFPQLQKCNRRGSRTVLAVPLQWGHLLFGTLPAALWYTLTEAEIRNISSICEQVFQRL